MSHPRIRHRLSLLSLSQRTPNRRRHAVAITAVLAMDLWLFYYVNSASALGCFVLGSLVIVTLRMFALPRPGIVHLMAGGFVVVAAIAYLFPDAFAFIVGTLGRDTTFTGRTDIWADVLRLVTHQWFGAGFESFFLGDRLDVLWKKYWWHPNEAHNGYLETYLTLGITGLCLLALLIQTGYRNAVNAIVATTDLAPDWPISSSPYFTT